MNINDKIVEEAITATGETNYCVQPFGENGNGFMISRGDRTRRPLDQDAMAFGLIQFDASLDLNDKIKDVTKWVIDSFFVTFKDDHIVTVDSGIGAVDINIAAPDGLEKLHEAFKAGFKAINAYYEWGSEADGSDQHLAQ